MPPPNDLETLLFSGDYEGVIARTAHRVDPTEAPALIGALALSGRLDEAESAFRSLGAGGAAPALVTQARFFVIAGLCHAGQTHKAMRIAKGSLADLRGPPNRQRFWVWQGLALVRYFEGRFQRARGFARRALASAVEASFPYARVLALDLLAHVLAQTGEVFAGLRLLEQAAALAESLGYADNTLTLKTARVVMQLRFLSTDVGPAVESAVAALDAPGVSYFTRRNGLIELASTLALAGKRGRAESLLEEARHIALPGSDRRGKTRWLVAHALASALSRGGDAARPSIEEARVAAGDQLTLQVELGFVELLFVGPTDALREEFPRLARLTGVARARIAWALALDGPRVRPAQVEDRLGRLMLECRELTPPRRLRAILDAGLLGLVPWALEAPPGQRIIVTDRELITENRGEVAAHPLPGGPSLRLLLALREGYQARETLVTSVWGLGRYSPTRHNAVINTAVSRLRLALGEPAWIVTHETGYLLAEGVEIVTLEGEAAVATSPSARPPPAEHDRVTALIGREGPMSSAEVGRALRMSPSTALRLLRKLADDGVLVRVGGGRSTRYTLAPRSDGVAP